MLWWQPSTIFIYIPAESEPGKLALILQFATGARQIPPLGLNPHPTLDFRHPQDIDPDDASRGFPKANTCANILHIPVVSDYPEFRNNMFAAIEIDVFTNE